MMLQEVREQILRGRLMSIGMGTRLHARFGNKDDEFKIASTLVGIVSKEYLIIRVPAIPGILSKLTEGAPVTIRYIYDGNVYGFNSTILAYTHKPALIAFMAYPTSIEIMNLRKAQRLECLLPAKMKVLEKAFTGVILDISAGGCRLYIEYGPVESPSVDVEQEVELSFHLAGRAEEQIVACRVQNLKKDSMLAEIGLQFGQDNQEILDNVKTYIDNFFKLQYLPLLNKAS
ncbi:MAG: flagellar brake protein [Syntrophobacteraceae bacterium]